MRFGVVAAIGGARETLELGAATEQHGWDGFFTWDALSIGSATVWDPWTLLAAVAARTTRITLGAMVFAPARHQPWTLARQVATLDHVSEGRLVLPVGLGVPDDAAYSRVGAPGTVPREADSARERAERLDDALAVLEAAAAGGPVSVTGTHSAVAAVVLQPGPVQRPRVPVWPVGAWPAAKSLERAARWDGVVLQRLRSHAPMEPDVVREVVAEIERLRADQGRSGGYQVVLSQALPADPDVASAQAKAFADAGVTWWIHADWDPATSVAAHLERIEQGPPRAGELRTGEARPVTGADAPA